jgi:acyl carrier protein
MNNHEKLMLALSGVLNVPVEQINDDSDQDSLPGWDSLAMVNLVMELETVFNVSFELLEIAEFRSVRIIKLFLESKGVAL